MNKSTKPKRSWALMLLAGAIILFGLSMVVLGVVYLPVFGWMSLLLVIGGLGSVGLATMALITGKPEWLLIDLVLPG